jgi:hypothetical protein
MTDYRVFKYTIDSQSEILQLPLYSIILTVEIQENKVVVYALIDLLRHKVEKEQYEFIRVITGGSGTGKYPLEQYNYLNTLLFSNGYVEHVFYRKIWKVVNP